MRNNCIHKSARIGRKARELGKDARLIVCWSIVPMKILPAFPAIQPHMHAEVEGRRVDVSLGPERKDHYTPAKATRAVVVKAGEEER